MTDKAIEFKIEATRTRIRTGFYNDLFFMLKSLSLISEITASKLSNRHEEKGGQIP